VTADAKPVRVLAADAEPGVRYKTPRGVHGIRAYYVLAKPGTAKRIVRRLTARVGTLRTDELTELRAARASLDGGAILFVRHILWSDPTGGRGRVKTYVAIPRDYALRPKARKAVATTTENEGAPVPPALTQEGSDGT